MRLLDTGLHSNDLMWRNIQWQQHWYIILTHKKLTISSDFCSLGMSSFSFNDNEGDCDIQRERQRYSEELLRKLKIGTDILFNLNEKDDDNQHELQELLRKVEIAGDDWFKHKDKDDDILHKHGLSLDDLIKVMFIRRDGGRVLNVLAPPHSHCERHQSDLSWKCIVICKFPAPDVWRNQVKHKSDWEPLFMEMWRVVKFVWAIHVYYHSRKLTEYQKQLNTSPVLKDFATAPNDILASIRANMEVLFDWEQPSPLYICAERFTTIESWHRY
jgi:hypothetical protein